MDVKTKIALAAGIAALLLAVVVGGWFAYTAYAQGGTPWTNDGIGFGSCHNNQAVLDLLKMSATDLKAQRQSGKSLLDIAVGKGVTEQQLTDALAQPMTAMHAWMGQTYPQSNAEQMTQYMRDWIAKDIRETKFGTMTDFRLFGGYGGGMMGGYYGNGGMIGGFNGFGGMMNGSGGYGGMMGRGRFTR